MDASGTDERRSLMYIRLAAFLAGQPADVSSITLSLTEIEEMLGRPLPDNARFPSWWRNDQKKMHSRAWLTAGWAVESTDPSCSTINFVRAPADVSH